MDGGWWMVDGGWWMADMDMDIDIDIDYILTYGIFSCIIFISNRTVDVTELYTRAPFSVFPEYVIYM